MKIRIALVLIVLLTLTLFGCGSAPAQSTPTGAPIQETQAQTAAPTPETEDELQMWINETGGAEVEKALRMTINDTEVTVEWEDNESVRALRELCTEQPLVIEMSMYGGFEQVGSIGQSLPRNDSQTTTQAGDIVLYSGDQIVIFYGSNSWAYTRLGRITDQDSAGMAALLGNGNVMITIAY